MSPTDVVVSAPVRVVTPKLVAPPEAVVRLFAVPPTVRLPEVDAEALPEAAIRALRLPTAAMATSTPDSEVAPKNELFGLERSISPVLEVIEEGAPVVIAPVWVMSPTDVVFRPPVKVVTPKLVVPPEVVARLFAVPPTVRLPEAVAEALPEAAIRAFRLPKAATATSIPDSEVAPKNELSGFVRVISPVLEVIVDGAPVVIAPVWVMSPTDVVVSAPVRVVTPKLVAPPEVVTRLLAVPETVRLPAVDAEALPVAAIRAFRLPAAAIATSTPESEVAPNHELFGFVRSMSPVLELIEDEAPVVMAPVWVMSPTDDVVRPPVKVVRPKLVVPPEVVARLLAVPATARSPEADAEALPAAAMRALRLPAAATATSTPESEVVPKNELFGSVRVTLPVSEVIVDGAPVVIGPVCVMAPTEVVVSPPVRVVWPKLVVPPELVARFVAVPAIARLPLVATPTLAPLTVTRPRRSFPALAKVMSAGWPPAEAVAEVSPCATSAEPAACEMGPVSEVRLRLPVVLRLPITSGPAVWVMLTLPPTLMTPGLVCA